MSGFIKFLSEWYFHRLTYQESFLLSRYHFKPSLVLWCVVSTTAILEWSECFFAQNVKIDQKRAKSGI